METRRRQHIVGLLLVKPSVEAPKVIARRIVVVVAGTTTSVEGGSGDGSGGGERRVPTRRESFVEKRAVCARSVRTRGERERGPGRKLGVSRARGMRGAG